MLYAPRFSAPYATLDEGQLYLDGAEACLRLGRCSALDVYRFQGRPNRLLRLAPIAPTDPAAPALRFEPALPRMATPEENILPAYRGVSQVRPEYQEVGKARPEVPR
jgi:hypothetical protein